MTKVFVEQREANFFSSNRILEGLLFQGFVVTLLLSIQGPRSFLSPNFTHVILPLSFFSFIILRFDLSAFYS
jgi:hypothetical protein